MVYFTWGHLNLVTFNIILLVVVACLDVDAVKPTNHEHIRPQSAIPPFLSNGGRHRNTLTSFSFQQVLPSGSSEELDHANPWDVDPTLAAFMRRFDIPRVHGSGIRVDLGAEQDGYRQVSGLCPVFGKRIVLYQPPDYQNDFLQNAPTAAPAKKPLPGGFNNPQLYQSGTPLSPVKDSWIQGKLGNASPATDIGRCAKYAHSTVSINPKNGVASLYKYPFVFDRKTKLCYVLAVSAQELMGDRYCSHNGQPPNLTWYCFEPRRDASSAETFVYGSSLVGRGSGDEWAERCPSEAVRGAMFGTWNNGICIPYDQESSVQTVEVQKREECWQLVFENERVASDQPRLPPSRQPLWQDFWPGYTATSSKSGGIGVNWANFYQNTAGAFVCSMFKSVPNCFAPREGAVGYTALGRLVEADLPQCNSILRRGECIDCRRIVYKCVGNSIVQVTEDCCEEGVPSTEEENIVPPTNGKEEEARGGTPAVAIAGGVIGGLVLLGAAGAAGVYYFRPSSPSAAPPVEQPGVGGKAGHRASDVVASTDMSIWGESADVEGMIPPGEAVETNF